MTKRTVGDISENVALLGDTSTTLLLPSSSSRFLFFAYIMILLSPDFVVSLITASKGSHQNSNVAQSERLADSRGREGLRTVPGRTVPKGNFGSK